MNDSKTRPRLVLLRRLAALLALSFLTLAAQSCHNYVATGLEALKAGRIAEAEREARGGVKDDPRDPEARLLMARVLVEKQEWARARGHATLALKGLPNDPLAHRTFARVQLELGATIPAADHYLDARDLEPASVKADTERLTELLPRAMADALERDQADKALRYATALRQLAPDAPDASDQKIQAVREAVGQKLVRQGRYDEAIKHYDAMARDYPQRDHYLLEQGTLELLLDRDKEAEALFERYAEADPAQKAARYDQVATRANLRGRREAAARYWEASIKADPTQHEVHLKLASLHFRQGDAEAAYAALLAGVKAGGNAPARWQDAARVATDHDRGDLAIELLRLANAEAAPDFDVARMLAELLMRRQRTADMEDALKLYLSRVAPDARQDATLRVVDWLQRQNELDAAVYYLEQLLQGPNPPAQAWLRLARLEGARKRRFEMAEALRRYLDTTERAPGDFRAAAQALIEHRFFEDAEAILKEGVARHKTDSALLELLAGVYDKANDLEREEQTWNLWIALQPDKGRANLRVGQGYARRGDIDRARRFLEAAAAANKDLAPDAWLALGEAYRERGLDREMRQAYEKYLEVSPDREKALVTLLQRYNDPARAEDALRILEILIDKRPKDAALRLEMAEKLLLLGETDKALDALKAFTNLSERPVLAARRAGRLLQREGHMRLALALYEDLIANHGDDPEVMGELGDLYWSLAQQYNNTHPARARQFEDTASTFYLRYIDAYTLPEPERRESRLTTLAARLTGRGQHAMALRAFEKAQALDLKLSVNDRFSLGQALLGLGRFDDAEEAFKAHLRASRAKGPQFFKIGEACFQAGAWEMALRYFDMVRKENVEAYVTRAFDLTAHILIHRGGKGRQKRLQEVALRTLELTRASFNVRQQIAATYARAGMWAEAVAEYRDLLRARPDNIATMQRLAEVLYLSGDAKLARSTFEEAARASSNPGAAWETIGAFYRQRGELTLALEAFEKVTSPSPEGQLQRGLVLASLGRFEEADAALQAGFKGEGDHQKDYAAVVELLAMTPQRDMALRYAEEATRNTRDPSDFRAWLIDEALRRGDVGRAVRELDKLGTVDNDPRAVIALLLRRGYALEALEILRDQIQTGNGELLRTSLLGRATALPPDGARAPLEALLAHGGAARLPMITRPLLDQTNGDPDLHADLGLLHAELGRFEEAAVHLSAASGGEPRPTDLTLAQIHLAQGDRQTARSAFARYAALFDASPATFQAAVNEVIWTCVLNNRLDDAEDFVRGVMARPGRQSLMVPPLTEVLLLGGKREAALDLVRTGPLGSLFKPPANAGDAATASSRAGDLIDAALVLAGHGFGDEALNILADAHKARPGEAALLLALVELGARQGDARTPQWATAFLDSGKDAANDPAAQKLRLAQAWMAGGDADAARPLLADLVGHHQMDIARQALTLGVSAARRTNDTKGLDLLLTRHRDAQADTHAAMLDQSRALRDMGYFKRASEAYRAAIALSPLTSYPTLVAIETLTGDKDALFDAQARASRAAGVTPEELISFGQVLTEGPDAALAAAWWDRLEKSSPGLAEPLLGAARVAFLRGDGDGGIARLDRYLQINGASPVAINDVLRTLVELQRWDAIPAVVKRHGPQDITPDTARRGSLPPLPPTSYLYLGLAHYASGQRAEALKHFDTWTRAASSPLLAHLAVARGLRAAAPDGPDSPDALRDAMVYTERALAETPDAPEPLLLRGQLRLLDKKVDLARADFDAYLQRGDVGLPRGLRDIGHAQLVAGHPKLAEPYLLRLARHPLLIDGSGLAMALAAFEQAGRFKEGLAFLQKHFPVLADAPHGHLDVLYQTGELLAGAGEIQRADTLYTQGLRRFPDSDALANNHAYLLARANRDLPRAERLVRRALSSWSLTARSQGIYLDTLAWVHQKQGKPRDALGAQLGAIRLSRGEVDGSVFFAHLADILDAEGKKDLAAEARYRARLHDPRTAPLQHLD